MKFWLLRLQGICVTSALGVMKLVFFYVFFLAQIQDRNIGNVLLGLTGVLWPRACSGGLISHISISPGSWLSRVACVRCVREYLGSQGPFLDLISLEHTEFCLPSPLPVAAPCRNPLPSIWNGFLEFRLGYMLLQWSSAWVWWATACEPVWTGRHWAPGDTDFSR